ncbi:unnamed protein product [Trichobilharzia regenti]|nr:unnamed protein product [Trichobilharzia regenti]
MKFMSVFSELSLNAGLKMKSDPGNSFVASNVDTEFFIRSVLKEVSY